jgi:hypothetical protein
MAPVPPNVVAKNLVRVLCPQHPDAAYLKEGLAQHLATVEEESEDDTCHMPARTQEGGGTSYPGVRTVVLASAHRPRQRRTRGPGPAGTRLLTAPRAPAGSPGGSPGR